MEMSFYWITRLDAINTTLLVFAVFSGIALGVLSIMAIVWHIGYDHKSDAYDEEKQEAKALRISSFITSIFFALFWAGAIFVPTTKEMCAIYVVNYLQTNEEAKQLPDKMIKAVNAYFDDLAKQHEEKKER